MSDQVWAISGATVLWLGAALLTFALFGDWIVQRFKRRRRCPKCWYDMSHAPPPGLTCSECGYVAKRERKLFKARERWRLVWLALLFFAGGYAVRVTPAVKDRGWPAAVPTTAIIVALPWLNPSIPLAWARISKRTPNAADLLVLDLSRSRLAPDSLWGWQEWLLVERCLRGDARRRPVATEWESLYGALLHQLDTRRKGPTPKWIERAEKLVDIHVKTRTKWPVDVPICADVWVRRWDMSTDHDLAATPLTPGLTPINRYEHGLGIHFNEIKRWRDRLTLLGSSMSPWPMLEYEAEIAVRRRDSSGKQLPRSPLRKFRLEIPTQVVADNSADLSPVDSEDIRAVLLDLLQPTLKVNMRKGGGSSLQLWRTRHLGAHAAEALKDIALGLNLTVLRSGETVAEAGAWFKTECWTGYCTFAPTADPVHHLQWVMGKPESFAEGEWSLRIEGNMTLAFRSLDQDQFWSGTLELPLEVSTYQ